MTDSNVKLKFKYKQIGEKIHILKLVFESEKSKKKWTLSKVSDIPYINGINIHSIVETQKFRVKGITDFRAETTMFPNAIYTVDDNMSRDIWACLMHNGFKENQSTSIGMGTYIKEIYKSIYYKTVRVLNIVIKRPIKTLFNLSILNTIVYWGLTIASVEWAIYSWGILLSFIALYIFKYTIILLLKMHKSIMINIYQRKLNDKV